MRAFVARWYSQELDDMPAIFYYCGISLLFTHEMEDNLRPCSLARTVFRGGGHSCMDAAKRWNIWGFPPGVWGEGIGI
jgi:hypothetical protein